MSEDSSSSLGSFFHRLLHISTPSKTSQHRPDDRPLSQSESKVEAAMDKNYHPDQRPQQLQASSGLNLSREQQDASLARIDAFRNHIINQTQQNKTPKSPAEKFQFTVSRSIFSDIEFVRQVARALGSLCDLNIKFDARFEGEQGFDSAHGGVTKEFFAVFVRRAFGVSCGLFEQSDAKMFVLPKPGADLQCLRTTGIILMKMLMEGLSHPSLHSIHPLLFRLALHAFHQHQQSNSPFSYSSNSKCLDFLKNCKVSDEDFRLFEGAQQLSFYQDMKRADQDTLENIYCVTNFTTSEANSSASSSMPTTVLLAPEGDKKRVTPANVTDYIQVLFHYMLIGKREKEIFAFLDGFTNSPPAKQLYTKFFSIPKSVSTPSSANDDSKQNSLLSFLYQPHDFSLLLGGEKQIDRMLLSYSFSFRSFDGQKELQWFKDLVEKDESQGGFSDAELQTLITWFTGLSALLCPYPSLIILFLGLRKTNSLPTARTCFLQLEFGSFTSKSKMKHLLLYAANEAMTFEQK